MRRVRQVTYTLLGTIFLTIGLIGFVTPILQGWFFFVIGLILISLESPVVDEWLSNLARKNSKVDHHYGKLRGWIRSKLGYN
jgi:uncharacterized membrane protein YbaN (DUF454 family)